MKVPFVFGPNDLRLCEVDTPRVGARDALLQVASVGICGSDLAYIAAGGVAGRAANPFPLGHELSGTVVEVGVEVTSVSVGDRVILNPLVNLVGNGGPEGGFAERLLVRDVAGKPQSLIALPASLSMDVGALIEPLAVAAHAIHRLGAKAGDRVAIFGAGPIGLASTLILRHRGVSDIVIFELSAFRRERAVRLGARVAIDPREEAASDALKRLHGATYAYSTEVPQTTHFLEASGAPVIDDIVSYARREATICVASMQKKPVALDFQRISAKELTITAALGYPSELTEVVEILQAGTLDPEHMISHRFAAREVLHAFATAQQPDRAAKVLVRYG